MLLLVRLVFGLLLAGGLLCFAAFAFTGQAAWRQRGMRLVKWTVIAAVGFVAVILLERLPRLL
jgi:hypothetical protein